MNLGIHYRGGHYPSAQFRERSAQSPRLSARERRLVNYNKLRKNEFLLMLEHQDLVFERLDAHNIQGNLGCVHQQ